MDTMTVDEVIGLYDKKELNHLLLEYEKNMLDDDGVGFKDMIGIIRNSLILGREKGAKASIRELVGSTYDKQKESLFRHGSMCAALCPRVSDHIDLVCSYTYSREDELEAARFCNEKDIGYVYLIQGTHNGKIAFKIGKANNITERLRKFEVIIPFDIDLVYAIQIKRPSEVESKLHKAFRRYRMSGEWFDLNSDAITHLALIMAGIQAFCENFTSEWTRHRSNQNKLNDSDYIEYLEAILAVSGIPFDADKRRCSNG